MSSTPEIRDRITDFKRIKASDIADNPRNWRTHDAAQKSALKGVLSEIGYAGAQLAYYSERNGGKLTLVDGHLRRETVGPDFELPVLLTDLSDREADILLATYDPISQMAGIDESKFAALAAEIETESDAIRDLINSVSDIEIDPADSAVGPGPGASDAPPRDFTASRNALMSYTLVFDSAPEQAAWFSLVKWLREQYPTEQTIAGRLSAFVTEKGFIAKCV